MTMTMMGGDFELDMILEGAPIVAQLVHTVLAPEHMYAFMLGEQEKCLMYSLQYFKWQTPLMVPNIKHDLGKPSWIQKLRRI